MKKAINHLKTSDPVLGGIIQRIGPYKMQYRDPNFHTLVRSIVYQQLSGKAALTIFSRLIAAAKADPLTPEAILKLRPARMRALGLSKQKLTYIRELARLTRDGQVRFDDVHTLEDAAIIEHFTKVKGVGVWTCCPPATWECGRLSRKPTIWRNCPRRLRWRRSRRPGAHTVRWRPGICGAAWITRGRCSSPACEVGGT